MGETTGRKCLVELTKTIAGHEQFRENFLRSYTRADARRVSDMHLLQHGVPGILGSLDCMHVGWRTCPFAWQGAYKGGKGKPTIILEAVIDYNLWFWHANFGAPGTHNDINVLDRSPLLQAFLDGSYADLDFEFELGGMTMNELFILVDGIYPELSRFAKTFQEPNTKPKKFYAGWQEGSRKDAERGFGVLQRKWHILVRAFELWYVNDIKAIVETCVILHNMMVNIRVANGEQESLTLYEFVDEEPEDVDTRIDPPREYAERQAAEINLHRSLEDALYGGPGRTSLPNSTFGGQVNNGDVIATRERRQLEHSIIHRRWECLHATDAHFKLREALMAHLTSQREATEVED